MSKFTFYKLPKAIPQGASIFTVDAPRNLTTSLTDTAEITLDWGEPLDGDVDSYNIYRDGVLIDTTTTIGYVDSGLSGTTQYCYKVSAEYLGKESNKSNEACETTNSTTYPTYPSSVVINKTTTTGLSDVTIGPNGNIFHPSSGSNDIFVYDSSDYSLVDSFSNINITFSSIRGLCYNEDTVTFFVVDNGNSITEFDTNFNLVNTHGDPFPSENCDGMDYNPKDSLFYVAGSFNQVVYTLDGSLSIVSQADVSTETSSPKSVWYRKDTDMVQVGDDTNINMYTYDKSFSLQSSKYLGDILHSVGGISHKEGDWWINGQVVNQVYKLSS